jgi:hypothetical protein
MTYINRIALYMATPPDPAIPFRPHRYWVAGTSVVGLEGEDQPDGSATVTYTGQHGANGICSAASSRTGGGHQSGSQQESDSETRVAEKACLAAVAKATHVSLSSLSVSDVTTAESGTSVMVEVPDASAPWHCLSDAHGHVQGVEFTGRDGD